MTSSSTFHRLIALGALVGLGAYLPAAAIAQPASNDGVRTEAVSYADLNLSSAAGQEALSSRIHAAAAHVCGPAPAPVALQFWREYQSCMGSAQRGALQIVTASTPVRSNAKVAELAPRR